MLTSEPGVIFAGDAGGRVDHDGDLLLAGADLGAGDDHVGLEQGALAQGGDGDLAAYLAQVGDGVLGAPPLGHRHLLELVGAQLLVGGDVGLQPVGGDLRADLGVDVPDDREHSGEGSDGAEHREEQQQNTSTLACVHGRGFLDRGGGGGWWGSSYGRCGPQSAGASRWAGRRAWTPVAGPPVGPAGVWGAPGGAAPVSRAGARRGSRAAGRARPHGCRGGPGEGGRGFAAAQAARGRAGGGQGAAAAFAGRREGAAQKAQRSPMSSRPHQWHSSRRTEETSW